jgi:hypothetical protein
MAFAFGVAGYFLFRWYSRLVQPKQSTGRLIVYIIMVQVTFWSMIFALGYAYIKLFPERSIL